MTYNRETDFAAAVIDLKSEIRNSIQSAINSFETRVGVTPRAIEVPIIEKTAYGDKLGRYCVGDVKVSLGDF